MIDSDRLKNSFFESCKTLVPNVGIGTTTPSYTLDVAGDVRSTTKFMAGTTTGGNYVLIQPSLDVSALNPGTTANGGQIQAPANAHLLLDLRNNDSQDSIAFRYSAANSGTVDTIGFVMKGNGNVGIGTTNPSYTLQALGNSGTGWAQGVAEFSNNATSTAVRINNTSAAGRVYGLSSAGTGTSQGEGNFNIFDATASATRFSITSSGNVGIGTTAPTVKLDVNGVVKATGFEGPMTPSSVNVVGAGGGAVAAIRIEDPNTSAGGFAQLILRDRAPASADDEIWSMRTADGGNLGFGILDNAETSYSEKLSILRNGKIGIGSGTPSNKLDVNGTVRVSGYDSTWTTLGWNVGMVMPQAYNILWEKGGSGVARSIGSSSNGMLYIARGTGNTSADTGTYDMVVDTSGKVGIGTAVPAATLHVAGAADPNIGTLQLGNAAANGYYSQVANNANYLDLIANGDQSYRANVVGDNVGTGHIRFFTAHATTGNTERMRISSVGNVGIGTLNPTYRMEVSSTGGTDTLGGHFSGTGTGLTYLDVRSDNTADTSGALIRLISKDVADSSVTSVDLVKYNNGLFAISNNETNSAAATVFNMGGSEKMRLTSTGALGIGVAPLVGLHLKYDAGTTGISQWIERPTQAKNNFLGFQTSGSNTNQWVIGNDDSSDDMSIWSTAGSGSWTPWMTIKNTTGNVGIGTSTVNAKLQVQGDISTGDGGVKWKTYSGTTPGGAYNFSFAHGLSADKIVSINCMVRYGASVYAPFSFVAIGSSRYVTADTTNINIYYDSDANWLSNPYRCIVQYVP